MGGVIVRDFDVAPELLRLLGFSEVSFAALAPDLRRELSRHGRGEISESEFWAGYSRITGKTVPPHNGSLLGKFFHPKTDEPTVQIAKELKSRGLRVVTGTNVIDAHYTIHQNLGQYAIFDRVYASFLMGIAKPDSAFFSHILNEEGIQADEAFFTDDIETNVKAAEAAGLRAFVYSGASALREQLASLGIRL